jgi:Zn-dependent protease with chaperone function
MASIQDQPLPVIRSWYDEITAPHYKKIGLLFSAAALLTVAPWAAMPLLGVKLGGLSFIVICGVIAFDLYKTLRAEYTVPPNLLEKYRNCQFQEGEHEKLAEVKSILEQQLKDIGKPDNVILVNADKARPGYYSAMGFAGKADDGCYFTVSKEFLDQFSIPQLAGAAGHEVGHHYENQKKLARFVIFLASCTFLGTAILPFATTFAEPSAIKTAWTAGASLVYGASAILTQYLIGSRWIPCVYEYICDYRGAQLSGKAKPFAELLETLSPLIEGESNSGFANRIQQITRDHPYTPKRAAHLHRIEAFLSRNAATP